MEPLKIKWSCICSEKHKHKEMNENIPDFSKQNSSRFLMIPVSEQPQFQMADELEGNLL